MSSQKVLLFAAAALLTAGCGLPRSGVPSEKIRFSVTEPARQHNDLASLVYQAAQTLGERAVYLDKPRPIIAATIVTVDDLEQSSTFGRLVSQLVANRIEQRGYLVRDVTYMRALALKPGTGELVLTREALKTSEQVNAQAVIAGTYAVAGEEIYLNLRLLNAGNGEILASADAVIPLNDNTYPLIARDRGAVRKTTFEQFEAEVRKSQDN
jgi:hypothetical protein